MLRYLDVGMVKKISSHNLIELRHFERHAMRSKPVVFDIRGSSEIASALTHNSV